MSDNVKSRGFIAVLTEAVDREGLNERLHDGNSNLGINHEGTLIYIDLLANTKERYETYGLQIGGDDWGSDFDKFIDELKKYGLFIVWGTSREYTCIWYNGSDSPMSELKKEDFEKK